MGREATITQDQVGAAVDAISAAGGRPTLRAVRERLGAGSMGTVAKLLQQVQGRGGQQQIGAEPVLPAALQRALLDFIAAETAAARAPLAAELAEQRQVGADLISENERLGDTIEDQANELAARVAEAAAARGRAAQLDADLAGVREDAACERQAAEAARTELALALARLEVLPRLQDDLAALRADLAREHQARIEAERQAAVLAAQLDIARAAGQAHPHAAAR